MAKPNIYDVARRVGVSRQTVTRAMNDLPGISSSTKARVLDAAADLGYRPSRFARGLVAGQGPEVVGVVLAEQFNRSHPEFAWSLAMGSASANVLVSVISWRDGMKVADVLPQVFEVDGLIWCGESFGAAAEVGGLPPTVLVRLGRRRGSTHSISLDVEWGSGLVLDRLLQEGCSRPTLVRSEGSSNVLADAFVSACSRRATPARVWGPPSPGVGLGSMGVARELKRQIGRSTDAFVFLDDEMASRAVHALRRCGVRVPSDVVVASLDKLEAEYGLLGSVVTLDWDFRAVAASALSVLGLVLAGQDAKMAHRRVRPRLCVWLGAH